MQLPIPNKQYKKTQNLQQYDLQSFQWLRNRGSAVTLQQKMIVDENNILVQMERELQKYETIQFYLGKYSYLPHPNIVVMHNIICDRFFLIYDRFQALNHSGIMSHNEKFAAPPELQPKA